MPKKTGYNELKIRRADKKQLNDPLAVDHLSIKLERFFLKLLFLIAMSLRVLHLTTQAGYKADTIVLEVRHQICNRLGINTYKVLSV